MIVVTGRCRAAGASGRGALIRLAGSFVFVVVFAFPITIFSQRVPLTDMLLGHHDLTSIQCELTLPRTYARSACAGHNACVSSVRACRHYAVTTLQVGVALAVGLFVKDVSIIFRCARDAAGARARSSTVRCAASRAPCPACS